MYSFTKLKKAATVITLLVIMVLYCEDRVFAADGTAPLDQLKQSVDQVLAILQAKELKVPEKQKERRQRIIAVVEKMFDFPDMARSAMGQQWNSLSAEKQERFVNLFKNLIEERYIGKIDSYDNQKVVYKKHLVKNNRALIYTDIVDQDLEIPIVYKMEKKNDTWLINDLKIENVSLIANYRRDFESILRREGFEGLVEKITKQLEKPETAN